LRRQERNFFEHLPELGPLYRRSAAPAAYQRHHGRHRGLVAVDHAIQQLFVRAQDNPVVFLPFRLNHKDFFSFIFCFSG
jgi:hypothetical protein